VKQFLYLLAFSLYQTHGAVDPLNLNLSAKKCEIGMDGGIPYGDIIVIGAIAAFILLRYRAMLGEPRGRDEGEVRPPSPSQPTEFDRVIQLPVARVNALAEPKEDDFSEKYGSLAETFVKMRAIDRDFTPDEFLAGARMAYEMLLNAYSKRDRETLKMLLSEQMYKSFDLSLSDAEKEKRFTDTTLLAINKATISKAKLVGSLATLTVDFVSEQIHLIRDESGAIIEGDASARQVVEDEWVLIRDMKSSSPNWTIVET
jgi:predicted lipid-binding transport protein (Tim44 family)